MERLDKILSLYFSISRSQVKKQLKKQSVKVNGASITDFDTRVDPEKDEISVNGEIIRYKKHVYIMMNKPKGVISASEDKKAKTVIDLVTEDLKRDGLFPAGRLDGDTTGFVLITDDGDFAHRILSPKNHVEKAYNACLERSVTDEDIKRFLEGVELRDGTLCLEAKVRSLGGTRAEIIIHEGKYHQVKRMFAALGNRVTELHRTRIGGLSLDKNLKEGECREITPRELMLITGEAEGAE